MDHWPSRYQFGVDFNYIPTTATFTVNYGGVYDISAVAAFPAPFPLLNPVQAYGAGLPGDFIQGIGNPHDSFPQAAGSFLAGLVRVRPKLHFELMGFVTNRVPAAVSLSDTARLAAYNYLGIQ